MQDFAGGGGSGAGSINIFHKENIENEKIVANAGQGGGASPGDAHHWPGYPGGSGGTGCITIGNISTGTFVKDE